MYLRMRFLSWLASMVQNISIIYRQPSAHFIRHAAAEDSTMS
nr:hypothetical protein [Escherichia coli]